MIVWNHWPILPYVTCRCQGVTTLSSFIPLPRRICFCHCLSVSNFAQKRLNGFEWNFQGRSAVGQWTNNFGGKIRIRIMTLAKHALVELCIVQVLLVCEYFSGICCGCSTVWYDYQNLLANWQMVHCGTYLLANRTSLLVCLFFLGGAQPTLDSST